MFSWRGWGERGRGGDIRVIGVHVTTPRHLPLFYVCHTTSKITVVVLPLWEICSPKAEQKRRLSPEDDEFKDNNRKSCSDYSATTMWTAPYFTFQHNLPPKTFCFSALWLFQSCTSLPTLTLLVSCNREGLIMEVHQASGCNPKPDSSFTLHYCRCFWMQWGGGAMLGAGGASQIGCDQQVWELQPCFHILRYSVVRAPHWPCVSCPLHKTLFPVI